MLFECLTSCRFSGAEADLYHSLRNFLFFWNNLNSEIENYSLIKNGNKHYWTASYENGITKSEYEQFTWLVDDSDESGENELDGNWSVGGESAVAGLTESCCVNVSLRLPGAAHRRLRRSLSPA